MRHLLFFIFVSRKYDDDDGGDGNYEFLIKVQTTFYILRNFIRGETNDITLYTVHRRHVEVGKAASFRSPFLYSVGKKVKRTTSISTYWFINSIWDV